MNKQRKTYLKIAIIGAVICFVGDNLLGNFYPTTTFGNSVIFPAFSLEWANANPIRFLLGAVCGVIALLMMYPGFYSIYLLIKEYHHKYAKRFIIASFVFCAVGILYHCVFAITAFCYNKLNNLDIGNAEKIVEDIFNSFICVAIPAAVGFGIAVVILFIVTAKKILNNKPWLIAVNPLFIMIFCIVLSKILPTCSMVNGVFGWGQQSIALFFTFLIYYLNYNVLSLKETSN